MRIFISSPLTGLKDIREVMLKNEEKLGVSFASMESFLSSPHLPKEECLEHLRQSDCVILIVGPEYGSIDPESQKSYTELEFDEAKRLDIKIFPFVLADSVGEWKAQDSDEINKQKHQDFFRKVQKNGGTICSFLNANDLIQKIQDSIEQHKDRLSKPYNPLVNYKEYFFTFLKKQQEDQLFRHDYDFVGREKEIKKISDFIDSDKKILLIVGRGGIGKSKIIYEAAKVSEDGNDKQGRFLFIKENVNFDDKVLKIIPSGKSILVLEDAHRYDQLLNVLSIFRNSDLFERVKLIITTRPSGLDTVNMNLNVSIDHSYIDESLWVKDLNIKDTEKLIRFFLNDDTVVEQIKEITKDCPLAAIIGSRLIAEKKINPSLLKNSQEFNRRVLDRFLDEYKQTLSKESFLDDLLKYIAALGPVKSNDKSLIQNLAKMLNIKESKVKVKLDELESSGLLVRRGRLLRITPDLLNDHILYKACISEHGEETTFPMEIYSEFNKDYAPNLLSNIAEIDWRAKVGKKNVNLLQDIWNDIYQKFRNATFYERYDILKQIEKASIFQPQQTLELIKLAIKEKKAKKPKGELAEALLRWTHKNVLRELPDIIKKISYHFEYLEECCQILWELGKDDGRELNPSPEHAIRVLQDIAGYNNPRQPVLFKEKIVSFIEKLSKTPRIHEHKYSIFSIIDPILRKEGEYTTTNAATFTFHPYGLNASVLLPVRAKAIKILKECFLDKTKPAVITKALSSLQKGLSYAHGSFGRSISVEEVNQWLPEQREILDIIKKGVQTNNDKPLHLLVMKDLRWLEKHAHHDEIKEKVKEILLLIIKDYDYRIYKALYGDFFDFWDEERDFNKQQEAINNELEQLAKETIEVEKTHLGIFKKLNNALALLEAYKCDCKPNHFLSKIAMKSPDTGIELFRMVIKNTDSAISKYSSSLIWPSSKHRHFNSMIKDGIATKDKNIILNIIHAYAWGIFIDKSTSVTTNNIAHLKEIINMKNKTMTSALLNAISNLGRIDPQVAKELLLTVEIEENSADAFCHSINDAYGIPIAVFTKNDFENILNIFMPFHIFKGQHYHVDELLKKISQLHPDLIISFLIKRLKYSQKANIKVREYAPLPYLGFDVALFDSTNIESSEEHVRQILDLTLHRSNKDTFWLPKLFETVSNKYSDKSIQILKEWVESKDADKIQSVSLLLREAPESFLFDNYVFIGNLIEKAKNISEDCFRLVTSNLFGISYSGGWSRSYGQPSQKHLRLKENGLETAQKFSPAHPAHSFYIAIAEDAERTIKEELARDEELEYE